MRLALTIAGFALALPVFGTAPAEATSCSSNRASCEVVCTPERIARYYAGSARRCTASCEPRWQQCMRTGIWVHLEDQYPGWNEPVTRW
jgi:hypothetical protein